MNNKKKGFTLIELLACLVVLGVIATILVPTINMVTKHINESADFKSAESYAHAAVLYYSEADSKEEKKIAYENMIDKLKVTGTKATKGIIKANSMGQVEMAIVINNKCYTKDYSYAVKDIKVSDDINNCNLPE